MSVRLFTSLYTDKSGDRDRELMACINANRSVMRIDKVYVIEELPYRLQGDQRLAVTHTGRRPTFGDVFSLIREVSGPEDLNIVANTDIFLSASAVAKAQASLRQDECYALSRWDVQSRRGIAKLVWNPNSQDCWMFRGAVNPVVADFPFGKMFCDNRLAYELQRSGYKVMNPAKSIKTYHLHESQIRNYSLNESDRVAGPYLAVPLTWVGTPLGVWGRQQAERLQYRLTQFFDPTLARCRMR